jgi:hypothetical protein
MVWLYFAKNHGIICLVKIAVEVDVVFKMTKKDIN